MLFKLIKFGTVGASGLIIDFGITCILKEYARWNKFIANAIGFICAVINNYLINKAWTFHNTDDQIAMQFFLSFLSKDSFIPFYSCRIFY